MSSTIRDVAAYCGCSVGTISNYLNGKTIREKNRIKIETAIDVLHFKPNTIAKGMRNRQSYTIAVLMPYLTNTFCSTVVSEIEKYVTPLGYSVILCGCDGSPDLEAKKIRFLINRNVDGIILMPSANFSKAPALCKENGIPLVLIDQLLEQEDCDIVLIDNEQAGYVPTRYLLENGHRDIAIMIGPETHYTAVKRLEGYQKALSEFKVPFRPSLVMHSDYTELGGNQCFLDTWNTLPITPTAFLATNYDSTLGCYMAAQQLHLSIPDSLSYIGFDILPLTQLLVPSLALVAQPHSSIAISAARLLYSRIQGTDSSEEIRKIILPITFREGNSVKKI